MITPDIARFAHGELQALLTGSRHQLASGEPVAGRALGIFGTLHGSPPHHLSLIIVEPMHTRLFAKILIALLSGLAVLVIAFAFTLPSATPDSTVRMAQAYFKAALQIFCVLVAAFWVVDLLQRGRARRDLIEKDV